MEVAGKVQGQGMVYCGARSGVVCCLYPADAALRHLAGQVQEGDLKSHLQIHPGPGTGLGAIEPIVALNGNIIAV